MCVMCVCVYIYIMYIVCDASLFLVVCMLLTKT